MNIKEKIDSIIQANNEEVMAIINSEDYYVKNASEAFDEYLKYDISNSDIDCLINNVAQCVSDDNNNNEDFEEENLKFSEKFERCCESDTQRNFVRLLYKLIAQIDMNAPHKEVYNPQGIVAIGKTGIRQHMWVENFLKYKKNSSDSNINSNNIKNCIAYLKDPKNKYPILQEAHYEKINKYMPDFFNTKWEYCKSEMNDTYLIAKILYCEIKDFWDKKLIKELEPYEVAQLVMYILMKNDNKDSFTFEDFKSHQFTKEVLSIKAQRYFQFPSVIKKRINNENPYIIIEGGKYKLTAYGIKRSEELYNELELDYIKIQNDENNIEKQISDESIGETIMEKTAKNLILYGPPGTGKTYNTVIKAMSIIDNKEYTDNDYSQIKDRFYDLKKEGRIEFVTFHQSYSYEEFVEGIKPYIPEWGTTDNKDVRYIGEDGIFKKICKKAETPIIENNQFELNKNPKIWKVSLMKTGNNKIREYCMDNNKIRIGFDQYGETITDETVFDNGGNRVLSAFIDKMDVGDIVLSCYSEKTIDAIGVITSEYKWDNDVPEYKRYRDVKWLVKDLNYDVLQINNGTKLTTSAVYQLNNISLKDVLDVVNNQEEISTYKENDERYILIIDEINRGDVSKIFGELITLIEEDKRIGEDHQLRITLPYSKESFGVPNNLYIIGTMNTADRSIALLDTALRRRFDFEEFMPKPVLLKNKIVEGINLTNLLTKINERITNKYDRDHQIGHSYLMGVDNKEKLEGVYKNRILPLLNEYFYNDSKSVAQILNCSESELNNLDIIAILDKAQGN